MKVVILWSYISGYMGASWRALAAVPGVSVFVLAFQSDASAPFSSDVLGKIPHRLLDARQRLDVPFVRDLVRAEAPDAIMVTGWAHPAYRAVVADPVHAGVPKLMTMDTQLRFNFRQMIGRRAMRPFLRRIDRVVVSGERAAQAARYFGFKGSQIKLGFCGLDFGIFGPLLERRLQGPWPRKFLFVGRYAPEKALDVLVDAYARYRAAAGADAWELVCCGTGPEGHRLKAPGIIDMGFVPPDRQAEVFTDAGAFVMASSYEPWGVAIAEGAASGLPLVCSDACGAVAEVLREGYNGYVFGTGDAAALARALTRVSMVDAPTWGTRSRTLASAYDAAGWPQRVFDDLLPQA